MASAESKIVGRRFMYIDRGGSRSGTERRRRARRASADPRKAHKATGEASRKGKRSKLTSARGSRKQRSYRVEPYDCYS